MSGVDMARHVYTFRGKGLTFVQPWATAVAFAGKDIENRSWRTHYRGPLAVHAGGLSPGDVLEELLRAERGGPLRPLSHWVCRGRRRYAWRVVRFDQAAAEGVVDFTHEREWRSPDDVAFDTLGCVDRPLAVVNPPDERDELQGAFPPGETCPIRGVLCLGDIRALG